MSISQAEYDKGLSPLGETLNKIAPEVQYREWINKRSGEVERVPVGIDPGFAYNPGMARARAANLAQVEAQKLAQASPEMAAAYKATDNAGMNPYKLPAGLSQQQYLSAFMQAANAPRSNGVIWQTNRDR